MSRPRLSIRGLMVAVVVVGFDLAALARINHFAHDVAARRGGVDLVDLGFGLILLFLNVAGFWIYRGISRRADLPGTPWLSSTPSPLVIFGLYAAVLAFAIVSVLFFTSGRF